MKIVGLCGQSGAGKTTALEIFKKFDFAVIDCDKVSRDVTGACSPCTIELCKSFGEEILNKDKTLNRKKLAEMVFISEEKVKLLNKITHKYILKEVFFLIDEYRKQEKNAVIIDAPVLFESGLDKSCDTTLAICSKEEKRLERVVLRDGISHEQAKKRFSNQLSQEELCTLADVVIFNDSKLEEFEKEVMKYAEKITS